VAKGAEVISSRRILEGKLIKVDVDEIQEPHTSHPSRREVIRACAASAVVPVTDDGRIVLVRQYRYAVDESLWEIPAGMRDPGEDATGCAVRELAEETGYRAGRITPLIRLRTTPGFCDETIDLFRADNLTPGQPNPDPSEEFEIDMFSADRIRQMIAAGEINDAKTITGVLMVLSEIAPTQ
jgi:ADP-ribose pyrophosphatase